MRSADLPQVRCPGALPMAGPPMGGPSVTCGPLAIDRDKEEQGFDRGEQMNVVFTSQRDPGTFYGSCCGTYTECVIWREEKARIAEGRETLDDAEAIERREFARQTLAEQRVPGW